METYSNPTGVKKINWRQFGRHWIVVFILAILAAFVIWGMLQAGPWLKRLQDWRAARALQSQLEELYRNDKYGGKTPEETFDLFITALERNDVKLASKYFVLEEQENWLRSLQALNEQNLLAGILDELRFARNNSVKMVNNRVARFSYGNGAEIVLKSFLGKWKISDL